MLIDNAPALLQAAAEVMGVSVSDIMGNRKTFSITLARQLSMTLWAENHSMQSACEVVGRKNHTNAVYARIKTLSRIQYCEATRERIRKIGKKYSNILES